MAKPFDGRARARLCLTNMSHFHLLLWASAACAGLWALIAAVL